jgi:hypothetical protein
MFFILTSIVFGSVLEAKQGETDFFKGISRPFPPPKNIASELMMDPKRILVFMETDQTTGTKFSLVNVIGGLPGGIPCVDGVNWPRGYEIVGKVPADVDLTDDDTARSLVNKGKAALFKFCPEASTIEPLEVWLFKNGIPTHPSNDYEVYASWVKQFPAAPGPRVEIKYHNKALERAKHLAKSRVSGYPGELAPADQGYTPLNQPPTTPTAPTANDRDFWQDFWQMCSENSGAVFLIICVVVFLFFQLTKSTEQTTTSDSSGGGYSSYDYSYSEPDSKPKTNSRCPACGGSGKCQNNFHSDGLLASVFVGAMTDLLSPHGCPACGKNTENPGKCSACGGSGEA